MAFQLFLIISLIISLASPASQSEHVFKSHPHYEDVVWKLFPHLKTERMESNVRTLSSFPDRNPKNLNDESERWLIQEIRTVLGGYKAGPAQISNISATSLYKQENHIAKLEGNDPELKNELVILGAHYETSEPSIGKGRDKVAGADDNATGCAVLFEVLHLLAQFGIKLKRSLEFHFYTGNGGGNLIGSEKVIWKYKDEDKIRLVKGMLNLDQFGFRNTWQKKIIGVVDKYEFHNYGKGGGRVTSAALTSFVKMLLKEFVDIETKEEMNCNLRCVSDNFSWHKAGVPAALVTEFSEKDDYDRFKDFIEDVNFEQVQEVAKLALAFVIELAELAEIPDLPDLPPEPTEGRKRRSRSIAVKTEVGARFIGIILLVSVHFLQ